MSDNPFAICRRIAQERAQERWEAENPDAGWRPQRVAGDDPSPAEIEAFRQWQAARERLNRKPDGMVGRRAAVDLIRARRGVTNFQEPK